MLRALVTSGPTHEPIDPVRFIGNRSSGKQGHAIAAELAESGFDVTLVSGPVTIPAPSGVRLIAVETAKEMHAACMQALPADVAICAAAVGDWHMAQPARNKIKKEDSINMLTLALCKNPDILKAIAGHAQRPPLVIGFAAETLDVLDNARAKRLSKGCDWILANDVSGGKAFDAEHNQVTLIHADGEEAWPVSSKQAIAQRLVVRMVEHLAGRSR